MSPGTHRSERLAQNARNPVPLPQVYVIGGKEFSTEQVVGLVFGFYCVLGFLGTRGGSKKEEPKYPFNDAEPIFAYYGNDKRTLLFFVLRQPDGPQGQPGPTDTHQIHNTKEHEPAWYWVHKIIGQEQIHKNTHKEIDRVNKARKKEEVEDKDRLHKMEQEKLFQAKIAAFELDVVRNTNRREMKSKIRRAKTIMELTAYVGAIIALENMDGEEGTN